MAEYNLGISVIMYLLLPIGAEANVGGPVDGVGPCWVDPEPDVNINFKQFAEENHGIWSYMVVEDRELTKNLIRMSVVLKPTCKEGVYELSIYIENKNEKPRKSVQATFYAQQNGRAILEINQGNEVVTFKATFMKYIPGEFAFYYICCDRGGDMNIDYRFALAHKELTEEQQKYIDDVQKKYKFRGTLRNIIK